MSTSPLQPEAWIPDDRYVAAVEAGGVGVWWWDFKARRVYWSPNLRRMRGAEPGPLRGLMGDLRSDVHPGDRDTIFAAIRTAMSSAGRYEVEFRVFVGPERAIRWLAARGDPVFEDRELVGMTGVCQDITERKAAELELQRAVSKQEAISRLGQAAINSSDIDAFLANACETVVANLEVEVCKIFEFAGDRSMLRIRARGGWTGARSDRRPFPATGTHAAHVLSSGQGEMFADLTTDGRFDDTALFGGRTVGSGLTAIIASEDSQLSFGMIGAYFANPRRFSDSESSFLQSVANIIAMTLERQAAQNRQTLLIRELRHRVGNVFAQLIALFNQTSMGTDDIEELREKYPARVHALARAHSLISDSGWKPTYLAPLIKDALEAFTDQVELIGSEVQLPGDEAFALTLVFYELATNASKYGCLSEARGRLNVSWHVRFEGQPTLIIVWTEGCGPAVQPPTRRGFGSKLLRMIVERQLRGTLRSDFDPAGLVITIEVPLTG
ncbi:PAS domain S-box-containing protein [Rhodoligotrophos appendicifer]|uniref:HWE histidine kinase domain-containing protein n=1 Tax=Rhodoligotrophos appendicifer TaxID=987056 RepID=UPI0014781A0E|nr:HWE histidine kinase domain-containing protein [Rhodoligotrophos appendicifer]